MLYVAAASHRQWTIGPNAAKKLFEAPDSTTLLVGRYTKGAIGWFRANTALKRWTIHSSRCRVLKKNDDSEAVTLPVVPTCSGGGDGEAAPLQNQLSLTPKRSSKAAVTARESKTVQKKVSTTDWLTDNNPTSTSAAVKQVSRKQQQQRNSPNVTRRKKIDVGGMATPRKSKKYVRARPVESRGSAVGEDCKRSSISAPPMSNHEITANGGKKGRRRRTGSGKLKQTFQENPRKETGPFVWDPNQKQISVIYNRSAKDVFSWITLSTHMYGPMLDRKKASSTTHEERMDWLKSWVFALDHHGVLPADLALVLDHVKYCSNNNNNKNSAAVPKTYENGGDPCLWSQMEEERDKKKDRRKHSRSPLVESSIDYNNSVFDSNEKEDIATATLERNEISTKDVVDDEEEDLAEDLVEEKIIFPSAVVKAEQESELSLVNLLYDAVRERLKSRHPRVIVVGDVHGCISELKELIRQVEYHPGDLLVFLGDLVCKGPDSHAVVTLARELGAVTVRGNHEYEVLRQYHLHSKGTEQDPPTKSNEHYRISQNLSIENAEWLEASPWYMKSIDLDALFVHAGLIQGVQLRKQNPRLMMNMRSILPDGTVTSKHYGEWPWARMWEGPQTVFFGHDAQRGLQIHEHGIGLDTGCVYGKKLTACVLPERQLVSVDCCKPHRTFEVSRTKQQHQQQTGPQKK